MGTGTTDPQPGRIYSGDCIELMKSWPDGWADLILTDPPYGIEYQSNMRTETPKFAQLTNDDNSMRFLAYDLMVSKMRMNSTAIIFCSWKNFSADFRHIDRLLKIKNTLIWHKGGGGIGDLEGTLSTDYEMAIVADKGAAKIRGKRDGSVWAVGKENPNLMVHPTQKPIGICTRAIETFSDPGDVVFDPFCGSGSSLVAAERVGRFWVGIELDPTYVAIAEKRIALETSQLKMF